VVKENKRPAEVAPIYKISERRVQQLVAEYRKTKKYPELKPNRRPKTFLTADQECQIETAYKETMLSPVLLYHELKSRGQLIPKNKIYSFMRSNGWIENSPNKQKQRKRCRYERKHTGSLIHADYHRKTENHPHCIFWLDDASRKIVSGGEFDSSNADYAIQTLQEAEKEFKKYDCKIEQINTDRGAAFMCNKGEGKSAFTNYCESKDIKHIPSRVNNPQTNGKVERRWLEYDKHRWRFETLQEWINWYNNRLTTALDIEHYETPNMAFIRRLPNTLQLFVERMEK
jgi:putative transposase